jgi:hypothetical protein
MCDGDLHRLLLGDVRRLDLQDDEQCIATAIDVIIASLSVVVVTSLVIEGAAA